MASMARGTLSSSADAGALSGEPEMAKKPPGSELHVTGVNSPGLAASNPTSRVLEAEQDRVLIESAQSGDKDAFRKLVQRHQRRAFAIALGLLRDEQDAREIGRA